MQLLDGRGLVLPPAPAAASGSGAARPVGMAYLHYLQLTCQRYLATVGALPPPLSDAGRAAAAAVRRAATQSRKALLGCFASPTVGTALHTWGLREALPELAARIDEGFAAVTPHLLLELSLRRLLDPSESVTWPAAPSLCTLAGGVRLRPPAGATALRFQPGALTALDGERPLATLALTADSLAPRPGGHQGFSIEPVWFPVGRVTRLALVDHNPIAQLEAHPDKAGNPIGLGERDLAEWRRVLDEALGLIERHQPALFAEMGLLLHELVPVGYHAERHLSCSYREAIGTVYLTLHDNVMTMAEALVHELQHNKINCAAYAVDFLENAFHPLYKSPVRPDPRPLWGILLAVHAFLPVAQLYRAMRDAGHPLAARADWLRRMGDIDLKNHEGVEMLAAHARWMPAGRALFEELYALDARNMAERGAAGLDTRPTEAHPG